MPHVVYLWKCCTACGWLYASCWVLVEMQHGLVLCTCGNAVECQWVKTALPTCLVSYTCGNAARNLECWWQFCRNAARHLDGLCLHASCCVLVERHLDGLCLHPSCWVLVEMQHGIRMGYARLWKCSTSVRLSPKTSWRYSRWVSKNVLDKIVSKCTKQRHGNRGTFHKTNDFGSVVNAHALTGSACDNNRAQHLLNTGIWHRGFAL